MYRILMKHCFLIVPLTMMALTLGGCASISSSPPVSDQLPHESQNQVVQHKALAAQHWGAIAADVAARTKRTLSAKDYLDGRALYVANASTIPFDQAFSNFMITALVEAGLPVSTQQEGTVEIKYETQLIRHKVEFDPRKSGYVPGAPENVGANFWVLRNVAAKDATGSVPSGDLASDKHMWPTSAEMLVTTSIVDADQFLQRTTDAYYIENADAELFSKDKNLERSSREWKVVPQ